MNASVNGIDMSYQVRGDGEPLLLLHGFTGSGGDWVHVFDLDDLARRHRLIVPDARGHGRSTNPTGIFTHRDCARDTLALLDQMGVARCKAIGASLGGNTLLHMATQDPGRIGAMVLVSATPYFPAQARAIMATSEKGRIFEHSYEDMTFTPPHLATIRARTLIVYGDRDPLYPVELALEMYRAIPDAALWVVPGGGHGPIYGADEKEAFARAALRFLG